MTGQNLRVSDPIEKRKDWTKECFSRCAGRRCFRWDLKNQPYKWPFGSGPGSAPPSALASDLSSSIPEMDGGLLLLSDGFLEACRGGNS